MADTRIEMDPNEQIGPSQRKLVLGIPYTRVQMTGSINGSNTKFDTPLFPIYPETHLDVLAGKDDIVVEGLKGSTYTELAVASLDEVEDPITEEDVLGTAVMTAAPEAAAVDTMWATGYEEVWPRISQDITPDISQDSDELPECGTTGTIISYKEKTRKYSAEFKATMGMLNLMRRIHRREKTDQSGVASGYTMYTERDTPLPIKAYVQTLYEGEEVSREYLSNVTVDPGSIEVKAGDSAGTVKLTLNIGDAIEELVPDPV